MRPSLWDWQDDEADRLRREGKEDLARCWDEFGEVVEHQQELARAARLAREHDEPRFEIFFRHWYVQQGLFRLFANPQAFEEAAERLELLARDPRCQDIAQHLCARESLCNLKQAIDAPGHAADTLRVSESLAGQIPKDLDCRGCFELLRIQSLLDLDRPDEAEPLLEAFSAVDRDDNQRLLALLFSAEVAERRGESDRMQSLLDEAEALTREGGANPDNGWYVLELQVRCDILRGDPARAEARLGEAPPVPPASMEAIRTALALARGWAADGNAAASRRHAEDAGHRALSRGLVRLAAEGALLAAEACRSLGDEEAVRGHVGTLENLLPQLRSRDLDERVGALRAG